MKIVIDKMNISKFTALHMFLNNTTQGVCLQWSVHKGLNSIPIICCGAALAESMLWVHSVITLRLDSTALDDANKLEHMWCKQYKGTQEKQEQAGQGRKNQIRLK